MDPEHKSYYWNKLKGAISEYERVLPCQVHDSEQWPIDIMNVCLFDPILPGERKRLVDLMALCCSVKQRWLFLPFWKTATKNSSYDKPESDLNFTWLESIPISFLHMLILRVTLNLLLSGMILSKNERTFWPIPLWASHMWTL